jgi:D-threo-aldose 1-dehydrogenase
LTKITPSANLPAGIPMTKTGSLGKTGLRVPPVIFGTSSLGNLYRALPAETKLDILREIFRWSPSPVVLDCAGKYGAGLALEAIGEGLRTLGVEPNQVLISNKLAWQRTPLLSPEPTFEPGVWADLKNDATQTIGYEGILRCWEQGCDLLGGRYRPQLVSVHDPDEYLTRAKSDSDRAHAMNDIAGAYRALHELKGRGEVRAVGLGAKDWRVVRELADLVQLDWVMLACSFTVYSNPPEVLDLIASLESRGIGIINSAVFHAGALTGGAIFDYRPLNAQRPEDRRFLEWREKFDALCAQHSVPVATACVAFALSPPGVDCIALNTSRTEHVKRNVEMGSADVPARLWIDMKDAGLLRRDYPYLG